MNKILLLNKDQWKIADLCSRLKGLGRTKMHRDQKGMNVNIL